SPRASDNVPADAEKVAKDIEIERVGNHNSPRRHMLAIRCQRIRKAIRSSLEADAVPRALVAASTHYAVRTSGESVLRGAGRECRRIRGAARHNAARNDGAT